MKIIKTTTNKLECEKCGNVEEMFYFSDNNNPNAIPAIIKKKPSIEYLENNSDIPERPGGIHVRGLNHNKDHACILQCKKCGFKKGSVVI